MAFPPRSCISVKIKLDENLPVTLAARLRYLGYETDTVQDEALCGHDDQTVWDASQNEGRFLITQDLDFSDVRKFAPGTHAGILLVRLQDASRSELEKRVVELFTTQAVETWAGRLVVATEIKLRIR